MAADAHIDIISGYIHVATKCSDMIITQVPSLNSFMTDAPII